MASNDEDKYNCHLDFYYQFRTIYHHDIKWKSLSLIFSEIITNLNRILNTHEVDNIELSSTIGDIRINRKGIVLLKRYLRIE